MTSSNNSNEPSKKGCSGWLIGLFFAAPVAAFVVWGNWETMAWWLERRKLTPPPAVITTDDPLQAAGAGEVKIECTNFCTVLIPNTAGFSHTQQTVFTDWPFQIPQTRIDISGPGRSMDIREPRGEGRGLTFGGKTVLGTRFRLRPDWTVEVSSEALPPMFKAIKELLEELPPNKQ